MHRQEAVVAPALVVVPLAQWQRDGEVGAVGAAVGAAEVGVSPLQFALEAQWRHPRSEQWPQLEMALGHLERSHQHQVQSRPLRLVAGALRELQRRAVQLAIAQTMTNFS
jgi:hypothetical protein